MNIDALFEDIGEALNIVTVANGVAEELVTEKPFLEFTKKDEEELMKIFNYIQESALRAYKDVDKLRDTLYSLKNIEVKEKAQ